MKKELKRILLIEDEEDIRFIAKMALQAGGFVLELCGSGSEGLQKVIPFKPDLIILDVMMPGMDGLATLAALRGTVETAHIPVVFMTANAQSRQIENYKTLGVIDVITKPFDPIALVPALHDIWERC